MRYILEFANLGTNTTYTYTIIDNDNVGALGPGGVGLSSNIMLLLQADDIDQADESFVSTWNDLSGNNHHAIQATATNQPTLRTGVVNGHNAVRFDGNNDFFNNAYSYDGRTVFVVYRMLAATQNTSQLPQFWGSYSEAIHVAPDPRSGGGRWSFDGGGNTTARHSINGAAYSSFAINPAGPSWTSDVFQMVKVEFDATIAISTQAIGSLINPSPHFLGGEIVEMSVFNITLNSVQSLMIENHLSAKYNIGINNDIYSFDAPGNFEHDVAGIGRIDINNFHLDARGNSVLRIYNPSDLDDNEFLIWGHNNLILAAEDTSDVPAGIDGRWRRVWRVNEVDASGNSVDVGSVDIEFDLSGTGNVDAADLALLIDVNNNGLFNDETAIFGAIDAGSGVYRFENVSGLANNLRFTLASADTSQTPLPVVLTKFDVSAEGSIVKIAWETSSEVNSDFFIVERSKNNKDWHKLTKQKAEGFSNRKLTYIDYDYEPHQGQSFYRLRQFDLDGKNQLYQVKSINFSSDQLPDFHIFPNPAKNQLFIETSLEHFEVSIVNMLGKTILTTRNMKQIDLNAFNNGVYMIILKSPNQKIQYKKLLITK